MQQIILHFGQSYCTMARIPGPCMRCQAPEFSWGSSPPWPVGGLESLLTPFS